MASIAHVPTVEPWRTQRSQQRVGDLPADPRVDLTEHSAAGEHLVSHTGVGVAVNGEPGGVGVRVGRPATAWVSIPVEQYRDEQLGETFPAAVAALDAVRWVADMRSVDLALVEVDGFDAPTMPIGSVGVVAVGELVAVDGFPARFAPPCRGRSSESLTGI